MDYSDNNSMLEHCDKMIAVCETMLDNIHVGHVTANGKEVPFVIWKEYDVVEVNPIDLARASGRNMTLGEALGSDIFLDIIIEYEKVMQKTFSLDRIYLDNGKDKVTIDAKY